MPLIALAPKGEVCPVFLKKKQDKLALSRTLCPQAKRARDALSCVKQANNYVLSSITVNDLLITI
jgi:hypothetical protein